MSFYSGAKKCLAGFVRFLFGVKIYGAENEQSFDGGRLLICANHISLADPVMLGASLRHDPKYMAKKELVKAPVIGFIVKALGAYPIDRGGNDVGAVKKTIEFLKNGESVIMFPQGTRCKGGDPRNTKVKTGCSLIARKASCAVLPILIYTKKYKVSLFKRTEIRIGKPIMPSELINPEAPEDYKYGAELIFGRITEMIPDAEGKKGDK